VDCVVRLPGPALRRLSTYLAWLVNPHLPKAEREGIWRALEGSPCRTRLSEMERQWLRLHAAVAAEAGPDIVQASGLILEGDTAASPDLMAYALATHMTGLLLTGRGPEAMAAIVRHGGRLGDAPSWQPVFRLLVGQVRN
jgi:hypothetical protein